MKIIKSLEESGLLIKGINKIKNEAKKEKGGFPGMLLDALDASLLGSLFSKCYKYNKPKKAKKCHIFVIKHYFFLGLVTSVEVKLKEHFRKKNQLKY